MRRILCDCCRRDITDKWNILEITRCNANSVNATHIQHEICDRCTEFIIDRINERSNSNHESI